MNPYCECETPDRQLYSVRCDRCGKRVKGIFEKGILHDIRTDEDVEESLKDYRERTRKIFLAIYHLLRNEGKSVEEAYSFLLTAHIRAAGKAKTYRMTVKEE